MSDIPKVKKKAMLMFRASVIYSGKHLGKTGCIFIKATSKEDAFKFIEETIKNSLNKYGLPEDCFKIEISSSSKGEVDFYLENISKRNYSGLVN